MIEVIVVPYHSQGHVNTMLQFAKRLAWKGGGTIHITLAIALSSTKKISNSNNNLELISVESIYDDTNKPKFNDFKAAMDHFEAQASIQLGRLITASSSSSSSGSKKCLLVYGATMPWALDVAKEHNILTAAFFTQACAFMASVYPLFLQENPLIAANSNPPLLEEIVLPSPEDLERGLLRIQSLSSNHDQPATATAKNPIHPVIQMVISAMNNLHLPDWVLFNSFDHLEDQIVKWMTTLWNVRTIGPTLPSAYLDKRVEYDVDYGFNLYKPNNEACMNWLNAKQAASVVYVSFGSAAVLSVQQILEIAEALKQTRSSFLWIVRETEQKKLPNDFISETSDKGLVISWCSQLDVLAHEAVGCFITHCGWNSTIEALSFGVPMLGMPQFMDQLIDAHFVDQVWGVGISPKENEENLVTCKEIKRCLEEIMHGQRSEKIKENAAKWKALAREAVGEGGSSDKHIDEILNRLASF